MMVEDFIQSIPASAVLSRDKIRNAQLSQAAIMDKI